MKTLVSILNRVILGIGILIIVSPIIALGGVDKAPKPLIIICFLVGLVWFGVYLYGYQKIYNHYFKNKLPEGTSIFQQIKGTKDVNTVRNLKAFNAADNTLRNEVDINKVAIRETMELRIKLFIVIGIFFLIYFVNTLKI